MAHCKICGVDNCDKHGFLLGKTVSIKEFSGSSPPEVFVGRWNYPNVYAGILSPEKHGNTETLSSPELWHKKQLSINQIISNRNQLIYGRAQTNIKRLNEKFLSVLGEVAMTHKSISTEFKLEKAIKKYKEKDKRIPLITNTAPIKRVLLQENPKIKKKVDYLVNDTDVKSRIAINELHKSKIPTSNIIKILSAGLLGIKKNRKLVPTRWSITAVDDTLSKAKLKNIKLFNEINEIQLFKANAWGNYYWFLLLPDYFSFEVLEFSLKNYGIWHDHESFFARKKYADSVTGAYYANRLALTEYLEKIKRQATCIVFREITKEYTKPLGVGILREISRNAFSKQPEKFNTIKEALSKIQETMISPIERYIKKSIILNNYKKQTRLNQFI